MLFSRVRNICKLCHVYIETVRTTTRNTKLKLMMQVTKPQLFNLKTITLHKNDLAWSYSYHKTKNYVATMAWLWGIAFIHNYICLYNIFWLLYWQNTPLLMLPLKQQAAAHDKAFLMSNARCKTYKLHTRPHSNMMKIKLSVKIHQYYLQWMSKIGEF